MPITSFLNNRKLLHFLIPTSLFFLTHCNKKKYRVQILAKYLDLGFGFHLSRTVVKNSVFLCPLRSVLHSLWWEAWSKVLQTWGTPTTRQNLGSFGLKAVGEKIECVCWGAVTPCLRMEIALEQQEQHVQNIYWYVWKLSVRNSFSLQWISWQSVCYCLTLHWIFSSDTK